MGETEISWTHRPGTVGRSWNPGQGCSLVSEGCRNCYAMRLASRFAESGWSQGLINLKTKKWNGTVRLVPHKLAEPLGWRKPSTVFANSMTDLFHEGYSNEEIAAVFGVMAACPQHTFQVLTKRAKRMREWFEWARGEFTMQQRDIACAPHTFRAMLDAAYEILGKPHKPSLDAAWRAHDDDLWPLPNVWIGVSVENQDAAHERIPELLRTPAAVRFLSCEPLIGPVDLDRDGLLWRPCSMCKGSMSVPVEGGGKPCPQCLDHQGIELNGIDWMIAGCESGSGARPCDVAWLRSLRDQCDKADVAFFLKQAVETDLGRCGDADNPNGDNPCGQRVRYFVYGPDTSSASCGCTVEGAEDVNGCPAIGFGDGSKRKPGGIVELPYLDGVQHAAFPDSSTTKEVQMARAGCSPASAVVAAGDGHDEMA